MADDEAKQQTWTPIKEAVDDLWTAFLTPPVGHLSSFIKVLMEHDKRFPPNFLADFIEQVHRLHGWNPDEDPDYLVPKVMLKTFYVYEKEKIKKKERTQRQKLKKMMKEEEMSQIQSLLTPKEVKENIEEMKKKSQVAEDERSQINKNVIKSHKLGRKVVKYGSFVKNVTKTKR